MSALSSSDDAFVFGNAPEIRVEDMKETSLANQPVHTRFAETTRTIQYESSYQGLSEEEEENESSIKDEITMVLSILYGIFVVILAIVFKVSEYITEDAALASKEYLCVLFSVAILWLVVFKVYLSWYERVKGAPKVAMSPHASNRWLKGVIALFGFAIVIKDSLEIIGAAAINNPKCKYTVLYFFKFILHSMFVVGQVVFLFFYSKIHILQFKVFCRFGIIHAMATNLAVWIGVIADETNHAIKLEKSHDAPSIHPLIASLRESNATSVMHSIQSYCENKSSLHSYFELESLQKASAEFEQRGLFSGSCACYTPVCHAIARAEAFLSPLLIEFCLVSSCLLYSIWSHVGKESKHHKTVRKPTHKFYKSYKGVMLGGIVLVATVIIITLLGTLDSGTVPFLKSYYSEAQYLVVFESFLLACNIATLLACIFAFYVYSTCGAKKNEASVNLDSVILFICLVGPLMVGFFSILSLSAGPVESKAENWGMSLVLSISDVLVSVVQVQLIVYGLHRQSVTEDKSFSSENPSIREEPSARSERNPVSTRPETSNCSTEDVDAVDEMKDGSISEVKRKTILQKGSIGESDKVTEKEKSPGVPTELPMVTDKTSDAQMCNSCTTKARRKSLLPPNSTRLVLRETIMFLVLSNTCLWIFLSLNGTVFKVYSYQTEYFGHSAWTTLVSVTAPLTIFLKLHFAACYFEIWSYS